MALSVSRSDRVSLGSMPGSNVFFGAAKSQSRAFSTPSWSEFDRGCVEFASFSLRRMFFVLIAVSRLLTRTRGRGGHRAVRAGRLLA